MASFYDILGKAASERQNHFWILLKKRWCGGSGIRWTICKSFALHPRQITTPARCSSCHPTN